MALAGLAALTGCLGDLATREQLLARLDATALVGDTAGGDAEDASAETTLDVADGVGDAADAADAPVADDGPTADSGDLAETDLSDAKPGDSADADAADAPLPCPAGPGCVCKDGSKCASGVCFAKPYFDTPSLGKGCATPCFFAGQICGDDPDTVCAAVDVSPTASVFACMPKWQTLCDPCKASAACVHLTQPGAACVRFGAAGNFCGTPCLSPADCASGFDCQAVTSLEGKPVQQCVPIPSGGGKGIGECLCSNFALSQKLSTACFAPSYDKSGALIGKCTGERTCDVDSLTACSAPKPKDEVCDTFDNDCDGVVDEGTCDDGKTCTIDFCAGPAECTHTTLDGNACDDGNACTSGDVCAGEMCGGADKICSGSTCFLVQCDPMDGSCDSQKKPDTSPCDDGNACTAGDICLLGNCSGGSIGCDDNNPCSNDSCAPKVGCVHDANSALCNDNNACTEFDQCAAGSCVGKAKLSGCDDLNPCTDDSCENATGCVHLASGATCSDGNPCTVDDACQNGVCASGLNQCACLSDADCKAKEDGDLCNGTLYCDTGGPASQCKVKASSVVFCVASNNPCLATACVASTGGCVDTAVADGLACDADGSVCTAGDSCVAGLCTAGPQKQCDDGNVCTDDACDSGVGCIKTANSAVCDDGSACTSGDVCQAGTCVSGMATVCPSAVCQTSTCDPQSGSCAVELSVGGSCDDGNPCTAGDVCAGGTCQPGAVTQCVSANKCATGSCDASNGACVFVPLTCDDNNPCTVDSCSAASGCVFALKSCDDGNACTVDSCNPKTGACGQTALACDDGNACTADTCNTASGCVATPVTEGTPCGSTQKVCVAGKCMIPFASPPAVGGGVSGGAFHTCARTWGGGLVCWGSDAQGQLGDGGSKSQAAPVPVANMAAVIDSDCGGNFTCAVRGITNATTRCWGSNSAGQLGNGGTTASNTPVEVVATATSPGIPVRVTAGGAFACELLSTKKVWCWGDNGHQQLGLGSGGSGVASAKSPGLVGNLSNVTAIAAGSAHACAIQSGGVWCWGRNAEGQCGQSGGGDLATAAQVAGLSSATAITAGDDFSCALAAGSVWCWGSNVRGQLGSGAASAGGYAPVLVGGVNNITDVSAGFGHVCARGVTGALQCWGRNDLGQVGDGTQVDAPAAIAITAVSGVYRVGAGDAHTCVVRGDGSVWCWGNNVAGALGNGSDKPAVALTPTLVVGSSPK